MGGFFYWFMDEKNIHVLKQKNESARFLMTFYRLKRIITLDV